MTNYILTPSPVQVRFLTLYNIDIDLLKESLLPFGMWSSARIHHQMPINIHYADWVVATLKIVDRYVSSGGWPSNIPRHISEQIGRFHQGKMNDLGSEMISGIRLMAAAAIRDDGSRASELRDRILGVYLTSRMISIIRVISTHARWLKLTISNDDILRSADDVWSSHIISGLSTLTDRFGSWAGWTEANLHFDTNYYRVYMPICRIPEYGRLALEPLSTEDFRILILPQLLSGDVRANPSVLALRELALGKFIDPENKVLPRYERFVDVHTCTDAEGAKENIIRITIERMIDYLDNTENNERLDTLQLLSLVTGINRFADRLKVFYEISSVLEMK